MTLSIRAGVDLYAARSTLLTLITDAENHAASGAGVRWPDYLKGYLIWVEAAERHLLGLFSDVRVASDLYTERHWQIRSMTNPRLRPFVLVQHELRSQVDRLRALEERIARRAEWTSAAPGRLAVLDTHVLLHYQPPEQVDWQEFLGHPTHLVVPLRVVEELDEKKYTARDEKIARAARGVVSRLRSLLIQQVGRPTALKPGLTIEIPFAHEPREKSTDADEEILAACLELRAAGGDVVLVTGDAGLGIRAAALNVAVTEMPEKFIRRRLSAEGE